MCVLAQICVAGRRCHTRARSLYALLLPHRERNVMVGMASCMGSAERFLGLLATRARRLRRRPRSTSTPRSRATPRAGFDAYFTMVRADYAAMLEARSGPADALRAAQLRAETPESTGEHARSLPRLRPSVHSGQGHRTPYPLDGPGLSGSFPMVRRRAQARSSIHEHDQAPHPIFHRQVRRRRLRRPRPTTSASTRRSSASAGSSPRSSQAAPRSCAYARDARRRARARSDMPADDRRPVSRSRGPSWASTISSSRPPRYP